MGHRVVAIGECMLELVPAGDGWRMGQGGDTYNTAVHLARLGLDVSFLSALGADPFSDAIRTAAAAEGVGTTLVLTDPDRLPGLYAVEINPEGERRLHYWRERSAARRLFDLPEVEWALSLAGEAELLYLSGITLSLFGESGRRRLRDLAAAVRARGGLVAFDPNYRPRGWPDSRTARDAIAAFAPTVTIVLPTLDDELALWGDATPEAVAARWHAWGAVEVVVKLGGNGCWVLDGAHPAVVPAIACPVVETTGAGDAFDAGYLAARLRGATQRAAGEMGNAMGAAAVRHYGAIMPRDAMPRVPTSAATPGVDA